jgi:hypothetical protein
MLHLSFFWSRQKKPVRSPEQYRRARYVVLGLGLLLAALPLMAPRPALAWWGGGVWIGGPGYVGPHYAYVPPPPVYYAPPPIVYAPPVAHWVPGHYNWRGFWIPGHWVG